MRLILSLLPLITAGCTNSRPAAPPLSGEVPARVGPTRAAAAAEAWITFIATRIYSPSGTVLPVGGPDSLHARLGYWEIALRADFEGAARAKAAVGADGAVRRAWTPEPGIDALDIELRQAIQATRFVVPATADSVVVEVDAHFRILQRPRSLELECRRCLSPVR